mgnify:CR=1 FL=1
MTKRTLQEHMRPAYAPQKLSRLRIMIDKESLSTQPNAAFISLSAVVMDFDAKSPQESLLNRFNMYVDFDSVFKYADSGAGHIDPQTILWWFSQSDAARMDQVHGQEEALPLRDVLVAFNNWVKDMANLYGVHRDRVEIWSCGPMQDQNWLEHEWRDTFPDSMFSTKPEWPWWGVRCGRSFLSTFYKVKEGVANEGTLHVGIDDCCNQARKLFAIIRAIDLADPDLRNVTLQKDGTWLDLDDFSPLNLVNVDDEEEEDRPIMKDGVIRLENVKLSCAMNEGMKLFNWQVTTVDKDGLGGVHKGMSQVQAYDFAEKWYQDHPGCAYPTVSQEK